MKKLSFILALIMVLGTFTFPAFAAVSADDEAKIGDTGYATFEDAMKAAVKSGGTVELLKDVTIDDPAGLNLATASTRLAANVTIEGNNHTITSNVSTNNRATIYVEVDQTGTNQYTLTINNTVFETTLSGSNTWGAIISKGANTSVVLNKCTVNVRGSAGHGAYGFIQGGKLTLKDTVTTSAFKGFYFYNADATAGTVVAEGASKLIAPSMGDTNVANLTFLKSDNPFEAKTVATVGTQTFSSLEAAVTYAAANGGTVELLEDVVITSGDGINLAATGTYPAQDFTVDGKGHTITSAITTAYRATFYVGKKTVTFKNIVFDTTLSQSNAWGVIASRYEGTHVILEDCTLNVTGTAGSCAIGMNTKGKVTLKNTEIYSLFPVFYDHANDGIVAAEGNSTYLAPSLGYAPVAGLNAIAPQPTISMTTAIRLRTDSNGIRFTSTIPADSIALLESMMESGMITAYNYGTLICKASDLDGIDFTVDALTAAGKTFATVTAKRGIVENATTGDVTYTAALVNLKTENYTVDFAATAYVQYTTKNGDVVRVYATGEYPVANAKDLSYEALANVSNTQSDTAPNKVTSYYVKGSDTYTKQEGVAYTAYGWAQRTVFQNYIDGILNYDPEAVKPLTEKTSNIIDHTEDVFLSVGRTYVRNGGLACDFTCTGIRFNAYCEGSVSVNLSTSSTTYFTVYIDGVRQEQRIKATSSTTWVEIATDLERDNYEIMLVKQSQFTMATTELKQVKINGTFAEEMPAEKELFIEFYGDSILNGSNIFKGGTSAATSDGTQAFGWLTAEALGADCNIIGCGGLGLFISGSNFVMSDVWNLNGSLNVSGVTKYKFERTPDAVVVELGVNDDVRGASATDYKRAVLEFVEKIRNKYGDDVPIVWVYGYYEQDYWELTKEALDSAYDGEEDNIYYCQLSPSNIPKSEGGDGIHPGVETSKVMAEELTAFLKKVLG